MLILEVQLPYLMRESKNMPICMNGKVRRQRSKWSVHRRKKTKRSENKTDRYQQVDSQTLKKILEEKAYRSCDEKFLIIGYGGGGKRGRLR